MKINEDLIINGTNKNLSTLNTEVNNLKGYVLYQNDNGSTGNIELNDISANYTGMLIEFKTGINNDWQTVYINNPNGKTTNLFYIEAANNQTDIPYGTFVFVKRIYILGKSITAYGGQCCFSNILGSVSNRQDRFYITKVVGYK